MTADNETVLRVGRGRPLWTPRILYACLFASGFAALAYEVLWTRILIQSFGNTLTAVTTVLAIFMGGLALGSRCFGRLSDRIASPLRLYAFLEVGIGITCLAVPHILSWSRGFYLSHLASFSGGLASRTATQFLLTSLALIVPTTLMGGTLPAVVRGVVKTPEETVGRVGALYGWNTLGAAAGAFAVGYFLIPSLGIRTANLLGVAANIACGAVVLFLVPGGSVAPPDRMEPGAAVIGDTSLSPMACWCAIAFSGAVGMGYQIVWIRTLVLVIGSSTYALSAILATFLLGIAVGSSVFTRLRRRNGPGLFALLQFGIALSALLLIPTFDTLPAAFVSLAARIEGSFPHLQFLQFLIVSAVVLVPTTLMGMTFPCIAGLVSRRVDDIGSDLGTLYAWNTIGAILGSAVTGFLLIPGLGAQTTLSLCVLSSVSIGTLVAIAGSPPGRNRWLLLAPALFLGLFLLPRWDARAISSGPFYFIRARDTGAFRESLRSATVVSVREGTHSTVAVTRSPDGTLALLLNGKPDASTHVDDMETQVNLGYVPLLLHPAPRSVAVIGLGSGVTAGVATAMREPESIDVIELEPAVVEASGHFIRENRNVLKDPRVRLHIDDGRSFLARSKGSFDVVISEPSNPWMAGIANLFTREFFAEVRSKLSGNGVFCQWLQGYAVSSADLKMVVRTFLDVFPDGSLWLASPGDFLLIGRNGGAGGVDGDGVIRRVRGNPALEEMHTLSSRHPLESLGAHFLLEGDSLREYAGSGPRNTDDAPLLEFWAPRALLRENPYPGMRKEILEKKTRDFPSFLSHPVLALPAAYLHMGEYLMARGRYEEGVAAVRKAAGEGVQRTFYWREAGTGPPAVPTRFHDVSEGFDGKGHPLPLFPRLGGYRPDGRRGAETAVWAAAMHSFSTVSGVVGGAGREGSAGLLIRNIPGISTVGFFAPLAVSPSRSYTVRFAMKSALGEGGEAGAGYQEYDTFFPTGEQAGLEFSRKHLVATRKMIRVTGQKNWDEYAFDFTTSPKTRMVHLFLYREGGQDRNPVAFDDIRVTQILPAPPPEPGPAPRTP